MLGVGRIMPKPWVHHGELAVRQVVQLSLTFDHRVCDGGTAGDSSGTWPTAWSSPRCCCAPCRPAVTRTPSPDPALSATPEGASASGGAHTRRMTAYDVIVLVYGAAKRLGGADKLTVRVGGRALLDRVLAACSGAGATVVVGGRRPTSRPVT